MSLPGPPWGRGWDGCGEGRHLPQICERGVQTALSSGLPGSSCARVGSGFLCAAPTLAWGNLSLSVALPHLSQGVVSLCVVCEVSVMGPPPLFSPRTGNTLRKLHTSYSGTGLVCGVHGGVRKQHFGCSGVGLYNFKDCLEFLHLVDDSLDTHRSQYNAACSGRTVAPSNPKIHSLHIVLIFPEIRCQNLYFWLLSSSWLWVFVFVS